MMNPVQISETLTAELGHPIYDVFDFADGFSFGVETELQAYKAAYKYRFSAKTVEVKYAPNCGQWRVSLYTK